MSLIIIKWKCEKCKSTLCQYTSFGYPNKKIVSDYWRCSRCGHMNVVQIKNLDPFAFDDKELNDDKN